MKKFIFYSLIIISTSLYSSETINTPPRAPRLSPSQGPSLDNLQFERLPLSAIILEQQERNIRIAQITAYAIERRINHTPIPVPRRQNFQ